MATPSGRGGGHMQEGALLLLEQILGELIGPFVQLNLQGHLGSVEIREEYLIELQALDAVHRGQPQGWITRVVGLIGVDHQPPTLPVASPCRCSKSAAGFVGSHAEYDKIDASIV